MTISKELLDELLKGCERPQDLLGDAPDIIDHCTRMPARAVIKANNQSSLINAKKFVYGEAEHAFIDQYLLRTPPGG